MKSERIDTSTTPRAVLEIDVNNHAGVMSHVVGLFSRRAYNVDGILACRWRATNAAAFRYRSAKTTVYRR